MSVTVRFAPSPTGRLHVGNIRTAILNWLFAAKHGGTFILRLDDTDRVRSTEEFAAGIEEDLTWLGLGWARKERQSDRTARYAAVAETLKAAGRLYPCFESEDELDRRRKVQLSRGLPPIYDRAALRLTDADRARYAVEERQPHWRFRLANAADGSLDPRPTAVVWEDLVRGTQTVDLGSLSDPVLIRGDGTCLYTFTSVVDDIDFAVTHIIRGEDHVTNTGVQIDIFRALGAAPPAFGHHSLLVDANGQALSKRDSGLAVAALREEGIEAMALASYAALVGTADAIEPHTTLGALAGRLDLGRVSRAPGRFDPAELRGLNARTLHALPVEAVAARLEELGVPPDPEFWTAVRGNLDRLADAALWWSVVQGPVTPMIEDPVFAEQARAALPPEPWTAETWGIWTGALKSATGAKGRQLFHPLRLALTGRDQGPELKSLLPLIGRTRSMARLAGETA